MSNTQFKITVEIFISFEPDAIPPDEDPREFIRRDFEEYPDVYIQSADKIEVVEVSEVGKTGLEDIDLQ